MKRLAKVVRMAALSAGVAAGGMLAAGEAAADGRLAVTPNGPWKAECGSCHIAYPPQLLSAPAWRRIMSGLREHFGTDASIDPAVAAEIGAYLERHAGAGRRTEVAADNLRITRTRWFVHEHDEVPPAAWNAPQVKSAANCAACHSSAEQGDFRRRNIRIPGWR